MMNSAFATAARRLGNANGGLRQMHVVARQQTSSNAAAGAAAVLFAAFVVVNEGTTNNNKTAAEPNTKLAKKSLSKASVLPHAHVSIWTDSATNRMVVLVGALNYSPKTEQLVKDVVTQVGPQYVFLDINQSVYKEFGIEERVLKALGNTSLKNRLTFLPDVVPSTIHTLTDHSGGIKEQLTIESVQKSMAAVFGQLRYAGIPRTESRTKEPWCHYVAAMAANGTDATTSFVLGGRAKEIGDERSNESMVKTSRKQADELVTMIRPAWKSGATAKENYAAIRKLLEEKVPSFSQATLQEVDAHVAEKLTTDVGTNNVGSGGWFGGKAAVNIVAVVMMMHMTGVEEELKQRGWEQVMKW